MSEKKQLGTCDFMEYNRVTVYHAGLHEQGESCVKLADAVMKHFRHCRCDQQFKKNRPCLYCQAKNVLKEGAVHVNGMQR